MKTTTKDLTKGTIWKQLIAFAIPLIWGNLFQLTYNMVDSIVVGQFAGQDALAAVGTSEFTDSWCHRTMYWCIRNYE